MLSGPAIMLKLQWPLASWHLTITKLLERTPVYHTGNNTCGLLKALLLMTVGTWVTPFIYICRRVSARSLALIPPPHVIILKCDFLLLIKYT